MNTKALIFAVLIPVASWGDTTVDKCTAPDGKTYWSNTGCNAGDKAEKRQVKEAPTLDSSELRAWARRSPTQRQPVRTTSTPPQLHSPKDPFACENARRMYNFEKGYRYSKDLMSRYTEMTRACQGQ